MQAKLGIHHIPMHQSLEHRQFINELLPPIYKVVVVGEGVDTSWVPPGAILAVRYHQLSENWGHRGETDAFMPPSQFGVRSLRMSDSQTSDFIAEYPFKRPTVLESDVVQDEHRLSAIRGAAVSPELLNRANQCGREHARIYGRIAEGIRAQGFPLERTRFSFLNEPQLWSVEPPEATMAYTEGVLSEMHILALGSIVLDLGVGWPGNGGIPEAPPIWGPFMSLPSLMRPNDWLGMHAYWPMSGPGADWKWLAGRYTQCPLAVPIILSESGIDRGVEGLSGHGWFDLPGTMAEKAATYITQIKWFEEQLRKDARILGHTPFTSDGDGRDWATFQMLEPNIMREQLTHAAWVRSQPEPVPPPPPPPPSSDFFTALHAEFPNAVDLTATLPQHPTLDYATRPLSDIAQIVLHHTATAQDTTPEAVARYHVQVNGWPGIGYHLWVDASGMVSLLNAPEAVTYHVGDANQASLGVCVPGNYWSGAKPPDTVTAATAATLQQLVPFLREWLAKDAPVVGHSDVASGSVCPGEGLYALIPALNGAEDLDALRNRAWSELYPAGVAYNPTAAFALYAREHDLGAPATNEFQHGQWTAQGYTRRIVYAVTGQWSDVQELPW